MMTKLTAITGVVLAMGVSLSVNADTKTDDNYQSVLAEQYTMALDYVQNSAEVKALYHQVFNMAQYQFDKAEPKNGLKKAVIVDIDETMLDNSPYTGWQVMNQTSFSGKTWDKWNEARSAEATPGSVAFTHYINEHGGKIFYVSNRSNKLLNATTDNMKALGFSGVSDNTVLLKTTTTVKGERFQHIKDMGYDVVAYIGDNINDFTDFGHGKTNTERSKFVERNADKFGMKFFILPNPLYGGWEGGLGENYFKANDVKYKARRDNIHAWDGK
ncbi:5'-nucleotidase, lipoprotein e(P4) family [Vibrio sp. ER1A]|uniref:5'-nucleotidase, lipoprotein e(P4) family n=1 Tax=Vibrio sp. ER1A TaxID=1517681 RepID=UPI00056F4FA8|nr:5'-nucleotidase, lipoprotein e(P4) family [Vibrio sp. ER1A]